MKLKMSTLNRWLGLAGLALRIEGSMLVLATARAEAGRLERRQSWIDELLGEAAGRSAAASRFTPMICEVCKGDAEDMGIICPYGECRREHERDG